MRITDSTHGECEIPEEAIVSCERTTRLDRRRRIKRKSVKREETKRKIL